MRFIATARGTMKRVVYALLALSLSACTLNTSGLRAQAAFDFQCAAESLELTRLSDGTGPAMYVGAVYGVRGCGRQASYIRTDNLSWVVNTMSSASPAGAQ
jgi:hypothetical protein